MATQQCAHCGSLRPSTQENCNVCGLSDQQAAQTLRVGALLSNRFRIERVLGRGGFGIAYKAQDLTIDRTVAVKEFFPMGCVRAEQGGVTSAGSEDFAGLRAAFLREGRALGQFRENGIVQVFDVVEANATAYIVMEYLHGETLEQRLVREGPLPRDVVRHWTLEILRSLEKVHAVALLHRDISPTNVILEPERGPVLIDFGAARFLQSERTATLVLKHGYAPPEQYQTHGRLGPWTDIYALSATLARVLTGLVPLSAIDRLAGGELPAAITERAGDPFYRAILAGLALRIDDRVQSAGAYREIIETPIHTVYAPGAVPPDRPAPQTGVTGQPLPPGLLPHGTPADATGYETVAPGTPGAGPATVRPGDATVAPPHVSVPLPPASVVSPAPSFTSGGPPYGADPGATVYGPAAGFSGPPTGSTGPFAAPPNQPVPATKPASPNGRGRVIAGGAAVAVLAAVGLGIAQPWKSSAKKQAVVDTTVAVPASDARESTLPPPDSASDSSVAGPETTVTPASTPTSDSPSTEAPATTDSAPTTEVATSESPTTTPAPSAALGAYREVGTATNVLGPANLFGGFAITPDGARLVYSKSYQGIYQLYAFDRATGKEQLLTSSRINKGWPNISADGTSIAFSASVGEGNKAEDKIFLAPLPNSGSIAPAEEKRLTTEKGNNDYPFFSRDGSQVYFTTDRDGSFDVHQIAVDGTGEQTVLGGIKDDYLFGLTPDGKGILVLRAALGSSAGFDVVVYEPATGDENSLTDTREDETSPAFSPDGSVVVFGRDIEGQTDLFAVDVATGEEVRLTDTALNEGFPVFTPSGDGIIFASRSDNGTTVEQFALRPR